MDITSTKKLIPHIFCVTIGLMTSLAVAQDSSAEVEENKQLEQITVTAQRRVQNIQDVPIAVTALPESFLVDNDIRTIEDLNGTVPGFYATNSTNYGAAPVSIRGIGGANGGGNSFSDEPVAMYVNDVYLARESVPTSDLVDVDFIQVLRGPQGTLYGRNSTAGAVLINTARPTDDFEGYLKGSIAQHSEKRLSGAISGGLSEHLQARIAFGYTDRGGWANNTFDGGQLASSQSTTGRLSVRYTPTESFTADLILDMQHREAAPATVAVAEMQPFIASSPFVARSDLDTVLDNNNFALNDPNYNDTDSSGANLKINWDMGSWVLDTVTSVRSNELQGFQDSDGTEYTLFNNQGVVDSKQWSQEIRLSSDNEGDFSWIVGSYFLHEEVEQFFTINNYQGLFFGGTSSSFDASQELDALALFADMTWHMTDKLSVSAGVRYSDEEKDFSNTLAVTTINDTIPLPFDVLGLPAGFVIPAGSVISPATNVTYSSGFNDVSPRFLVNYQYAKGVLGYASYNQGYKSGGFNSFGTLPAFESENIDAYEVGLKSDWLDRSLRVNMAAFVYNYKDLQVRLPVPTGGVNIENAGEADVKGLELEMTYAVTADFMIKANATWMDTELVEFNTQQIPDESVILLGLPITLESINAAGNELTRAPKFQYFIQGNYSFEIGENWLADFSFNARYQDRVYFLETNQTADTFSGDDITEVGLRLAISSYDETWVVGLFGQNITNQRTVTQVSSLGGFPNAAVNEPSKWGVDFTYRF